MTTEAPEVPTASGLRGRLERGGFWTLLVVVIVYLGLYLGSGWLAGQVDPSGYADDDLLSSLGSVFFQLTVGLIAGAVILLAFTTTMGWNAELFGRQPTYRSWWMWLGPIMVALPIILRVFDIDWGGRALSVVLLVVASGLMVGFVEELLYRGIAVKMLRAAGHRELTVAALSSLLFGLSHGINLFGDQGLDTVAPTIVYTIAFGVLMYLSQRVIGFLVGAMILHGLTDPTTILAAGGIDKVPGEGGSSALADAAGLVTVVLIVVGFLLLACVRGKAGEAKGTKAGAHA